MQGMRKQVLVMGLLLLVLLAGCLRVSPKREPAVIPEKETEQNTERDHKVADSQNEPAPLPQVSEPKAQPKNREPKPVDKPIVSTPPAPPPTAETYAFANITYENFRLLNQEREKAGFATLKSSLDLNAVARKVAEDYLASGRDATSDEIRKLLNAYPGYAVVSFSVNRVAATGSNKDELMRWFSEKRADDVSGSQGLRDNFLKSDITQTGMACVGAMVVEDGKELFKVVYVHLFTPTPPPAGLTSYQQIAAENIVILNQERANLGLSRLETHAQLTELALAKARDLVRYNYFQHESLRLGSPHEMIMAGVTPRPQMTGENLWKIEGTYHSGFLHGAAQKSHTGLMNSEGHRANLLHADYTHIGVASVGGVVDTPAGKVYQLVLVQLFIRAGN